MQKLGWIIAASSVALVLLIGFQVNWLMHSRNLLEQQFEQKVTMALCHALEQVKEDVPTATVSTAMVPMGFEFGKLMECKSDLFTTNVDEGTLHTAIGSALQLYDIDAAYQVNFLNNKEPREAFPYTCSMETLGQKNEFVQVTFPEKQAYVFQKMGVMVGSSIFILLFISSMLVLALYNLIRQKRTHEMSVDFFNNMAHEFRTPLTNMSLALSLYQKKQGNQTANRFLQIIQHENSRLLQQVERILQVAELEEGQHQLTKESIQMENFVAEIVEDMHLQVASRNGVIQVHPTNDLIELRADRLHLGNVIRNLIDNALKYCSEQPDIHIRLAQTDGQVHLFFRDNGKGICKHQQGKIFDKFHRTSQGDVHEQKGFGLGLAYVKTVLALHGGSVTVQSKPGQGSEFHLIIPQN